MINYLSDEAKKYKDSINFGTKLLIIISLLCEFIDIKWILDGKAFNLFCNIPKNIIENYEFWRLFIPQFFSGGWFNIAVSLWALLFVREVEKQKGTISFLCDGFLKNIIIQIIFVLFCWGFSLLDPQLLDVSSFGFWNITFIYMMNKAILEQDETHKLFCCSLSSKWYPPLFFIILNLLEFPRMDLVASTIFAFIENQFCDGQLLRLPKNFVYRIESCFPFSKVQSRADFITCDGVNGGNIFNSEEIQDRPQKPLGSQIEFTNMTQSTISQSNIEQ